MSNFQRTRSKVWWGDSPPNLGSPVAQASNWEARQQQLRNEEDWEPQLPRWVAQPEEVEESPPPANISWSRNSPGSHKSQDSGFSDSDSSPPAGQQNAKEKSKNESKDKIPKNAEDNAEKCCQNPPANLHNCNTPRKDLNNTVLSYLQTPRASISKYANTPVRSLIKTPKDVQDYLQAHCDIGHQSFDSIHHEADNGCPIKVLRSSTKKSTLAQHKNINNNIVTEKCDAKKNLMTKFECYENSTKQSESLNNVDMNQNSQMNDSNIEYIQLSPSQQIAVNNQPRVRSPITRISYHTPVHFITKNTGSPNASSVSTPCSEKEDDYGFKNETFQRNGVNRSLNFTTQRLDEQILDDGPHSLGYIEVMRQQESIVEENRNVTTQEANIRALSHRKITDSLNLKTPKKSTTSRTKQKIQSKASKSKQAPKMNRSFFNFLPKRHDSFKTIYDITRATADTDRVPTLGLPTSHNENDWVVVNNPKNENFCERQVDENMNTEKSKSPKSILKTPGIYKISPPIEFQDPSNETKAVKHSPRFRKNGTSLRKVISTDDIQFSEFELNACTSTPKALQSRENLMLPPSTPQGIKNKMKPMNLLTNFNESLRPSDDEDRYRTNLTPLEKVSNGHPAPVKHWLCELVGVYEPECMTTLQSKALGVDLNSKIATSSATITGNIRKVQTHGQIIAHQFKQVRKDLQKTNVYIVQQCNNEINAMIANINEFVLAHSITLKIKPPGETPDRWDKIKHALQNNIQKVTEVTEDINVELNETHPEIGVLERHLKTLLDIFIETARAVLVQQMRTLVSMLEEPPSDMILKSTLTSLGHLGALMSPEGDALVLSEAESFKFLTELPFIECGVPRALLSVIIESNKSSIKALSLRALATICVSSEAVQQFEEGGGIEILSDILNEESNPEPQMREAVTVLTQITAPWLEGDYMIKEMTAFLDLIIKNLTGILSRTSCCQLLLLCTACLVNLVNMAKQKERQQLSGKCNESQQSDIVEVLTRHKTMINLLESVKKRGPNASVFLQEQTATLINVVSTSTKGQLLLAGCPATAVALVCFLRAPCSSPARPARLQAEFRLVNQAAEALARLCNIAEVTTQVIQLEGVTRLIRVIQAQKLQKTDVKCSDQILVNCLRALRLVAKNHNDCFNEVDCDVTNMIKPALMESVKLYSAKQESYV